MSPPRAENTLKAKIKLISRINTFNIFGYFIAVMRILRFLNLRKAHHLRKHVRIENSVFIMIC